jgi:hypothetical protein
MAALSLPPLPIVKNEVQILGKNAGQLLSVTVHISHKRSLGNFEATGNFKMEKSSQVPNPTLTRIIPAFSWSRACATRVASWLDNAIRVISYGFQPHTYLHTHSFITVHSLSIPGLH